jgi:phage-related protein
MTVGFDDLSSTRRVPDRDVRKNIKPIYSITSFGDGYESRVSIGTDGREESYDITFNNRPIDEIVAIAGFFENRAKDKTFDFTVPDSSLPAGEKDIVVYCDNYTTTYYNDEVGSIAAKLVRVYELVSGTVSVNITTPSFNMNEGQTRTINVSTSERGPELLYWTIDSATTADFTAVSGSFTTSGTTTLSTGSFDIQTLEDLTTEGPEDFNISVRSGSTGGPILDQIVVTVQDTSTGPEFFQWQDSGGASLATGYVLQQDSITLFVGVQNYDPANPLYWTFLGPATTEYSPSTGQINLTGTFASSTGSITLNAPATSVDLEDIIYLRKDSISGPIVDQVTLFTLESSGAAITDSAYNSVDSVSLGPNESPQYEVTVYFKGTLFPIEQIY